MNMFKSKTILATISIINALCLALLFSSINISAYTAKDVTDKSKTIINTILPWSGAQQVEIINKDGKKETVSGKSLFMQESDPTQRTKNIFDGNNNMPDGHLPSIQAMKSAQTFIRQFAPNSDSLSKAWNQIVIANKTIQHVLSLANQMKDTSIAAKVDMFATAMPTIKQIRDSLNNEIKTVNDVRMWFYDTQASKDIVLATLPVFRTALDRILSDFSMLQNQLLKTQNNAAQAIPTAPKLTQKEQDKINQQKGPFVAELKALFANRNSKNPADIGTTIKPSAFKKEIPNISTQPASAPKAPAAPQPKSSAAQPVEPTAARSNLLGDIQNGAALKKTTPNPRPVYA